jgi:hypothetical protein
MSKSSKSLLESLDIDESLDESKTPNESAKAYFYCKSTPDPITNESKLYRIPLAAVCLSTHLNTVAQNKHKGINACESPETAYEIPCIIDGKNEKYPINTVQHLDFIVEYLKIWESNPLGSNYCSIEPVRARNPEKIIRPNDLALIRSYCNVHLPAIEEKIKREKVTASPDSDPTLTNVEKNYAKILSLNSLVSSVTYLGITCLLHKLLGFIAAIISNSSMQDFAEVSKNPIFITLQKESIEEWNRQNNNKLSNLITANTVGHGVTDLELLDDS